MQNGENSAWLLLLLTSLPSRWATHGPCSPCSGSTGRCCVWNVQATSRHSCLEGSAAHPTPLPLCFTL